ncbi:PAQR family membrane homeostasis protein TrhA [Lutibaculum baratangense]|uniref:Putative membrane protein hemolysin III n=1 Tax=Lutibaculum baratangense AMV1 TaxID=631454 RepID=V4QUB9_9HYPH|nr:hemolysin III family protein [Lutibaculum baratangense]ESR23362.1 putative membrane protein hemolysin III [Lutibaculum baratangense AMV1]
MSERFVDARSWNYTPAELWADGIVHAVGLVLGVVAATALFIASLERFDLVGTMAVSTYAASLLLSLGLSATYNIWPVGRTKWLLRRFDHSAIYLLIAGTYTPFMIEAGTYRLMAVVWTVAVAGVALKLIRPGRYERLSIYLYLALGWSGVSALDVFIETLPRATLWLILAGGLVYTLGVIFHLWQTLRFHNPIWHGLVLVAASIHFAAVWICVTA